MLQKQLKELRSKARLLEAKIQIGKNGITPNLITQINNQLEKNKIVKIKALKSSLANKSMKEIVEEIVNKTNSTLVNSIGFTLTIYKKNHR